MHQSSGAVLPQNNLPESAVAAAEEPPVMPVEDVAAITAARAEEIFEKEIPEAVEIEKAVYEVAVEAAGIEEEIVGAAAMCPGEKRRVLEMLARLKESLGDAPPEQDYLKTAISFHVLKLGSRVEKIPTCAEEEEAAAPAVAVEHDEDSESEQEAEEEAPAMVVEVEKGSDADEEANAVAVESERDPQSEREEEAPAVAPEMEKDDSDSDSEDDVDAATGLFSGRSLLSFVAKVVFAGVYFYVMSGFATPSGLHL